MQIDYHSGRVSTLDSDCIIVGHLKDTPLIGAAAEIDRESGGAITALIESGDCGHKSGRIRHLYNLPGVRSPRVLVVGLGKKEEYGAAKFIKACGDAAAPISKSPAQRILNCLTEIPVDERAFEWHVTQSVAATNGACYLYSETKKPRNPVGIEQLLILDPDQDGTPEMLGQANAIADAIATARELGNLPPNICTPAFLAEHAQGIASRNANSEVTILEREQMEAAGMGALLGVAHGSCTAPKLIVLQHQGAEKDQRPHVLVGKGITFDSGGISLKPGLNMHEMKFDMCGAATVLATFEAVATMQLPINLVAIVPAVENMPDGKSCRPGDVLTSMSGKTIEILNTDAEGRLILCDALTYAHQFNAKSIVDVATLTGACVIALGKHASGLLTNDDSLSEALLDAGDVCGDRAWRLPLWDDYQEQIDSPVADVANSAGRPAGTITAACFLARFMENQRWAHLDVAGTAWHSGSKKGATGRPTHLLIQYLLGQV